jgi:hypothetical protein
MKEFIIKNRVLVSGIISALLLALQQFIGIEKIDYKVVAYAGLMAVISVLANTWKLKGLTIAGIIGTLAKVFYDVQTGGEFSWEKFGILACIALLSATSEALKGVPNDELPK